MSGALFGARVAGGAAPVAAGLRLPRDIYQQGNMGCLAPVRRALA
jgi:hypothetical protein